MGVYETHMDEIELALAEKKDADMICAGFSKNTKK